MDNLNLNLKDLKLSKEDSRDIIELLAKKRKILKTINANQMINYCKL